MQHRRREFLRLGALSAAAAAWPRGARSAAQYRVGVARDTNAYAATQRAIDASGEWPSARVAGRVVVIKPNLVQPKLASTGCVTDPEVVRAIADRALADGAAEVRVIETSPSGPLFSHCGYDYLEGYGEGRVRLVDIGTDTFTLAPLSGGLAYGAISMPASVLGPEIVFVSAAKLKTHVDAVMTLTLKNLFGLPEHDRYLSYLNVARFAMHDRSVHQTIVDLARLRPIDFAVVDGVIGMEGAGPLSGTPVALDTVLAGRNALAVDRVAVAKVELPQRAVRHLDYAAYAGLGPFDMNEVEMAGEPLEPRPIQIPRVPPFLEFPRVLPGAFDPAGGQKTTIGVHYSQPCLRQLDILRLSDDTARVEVVKTFNTFSEQAAGYQFVTWDGRRDDGTLAPAGKYAAHVRAFHMTADGRPMDGVGWVTVIR